MEQQREQQFLEDINDNMGIIHKISSMYSWSQADKEDLKQEMLFHLWKSYDAFQGKSKFSTWMYRVCLNTALTFYRKSRNSLLESLDGYENHLRGEVAATSSHEQDKIVLLNQAVKKLSSINKAIILLYFEELSYEEIAQITGLSKKNISVRLVRIKKEIEKELIKFKNIYYGSA